MDRRAGFRIRDVMEDLPRCAPRHPRRLLHGVILVVQFFVARSVEQGECMSALRVEDLQGPDDLGVAGRSEIFAEDAIRSCDPLGDPQFGRGDLRSLSERCESDSLI